jgi:hypothetical protein
MNPMNLLIRRLLAFGLDYVVIVGYLVVLAGVSLAILASGLRAAFSAAWRLPGRPKPWASSC